ncbi:MAG: ATP-binding protein [Planctomycetota bacterium]
MSESQVSSAPSEPRNIWQRLVRAVVLPPEVSAFERSYLERINRIALVFFYAHLPAFLLIAWINDTGPLFTFGLTAAVLAVPTLGLRAFESPRARSMVFGFTAMCMGGVLVHIGQGPVQIEMHFYFFSILAMLALFANPMVVVVGAVTVAVHHLLLWYLVPDSVFNYDAPLWVVLVHAGFVVLETFAACFIARNFFDNVIGLEKKVEERTVEIRRRNEDMRLVLDNVQQGLVTVTKDGALCAEHSRCWAEWFGSYEPGESVVAYLSRSDEKFGMWFAVCWESLSDGFLPLELAIDQMPRRTYLGGRHLKFEYRVILDADEQLENVMLVATDVTADVAKQEAEARQREILTLFERILHDRQGFVEFFEEAGRLVELSQPSQENVSEATKRSLHTLKGNAALFGLDSIASLCNQVEARIADGEISAAVDQFENVQERWLSLSETVERMLGHEEGDDVTISGDEYRELLRMVVEQADHTQIAGKLVDVSLEPAEMRFSRFAEQAQALAQRLDKGAVEVAIEANGVRFERQRFMEFWGSFVHVLRNALDHGIETPEQRSELGKPDAAKLQLRAFEERDEVVVELRDDGRGIDWDRVRLKADQLGLPHATDSELVDALFAAGLSTRDDANEISGRGVGLGAVREACEALGGRVETCSESGVGTVFQFRFPGAVAKNREALAHSDF